MTGEAAGQARRADGYAAIRIGAAVAVLFGHSFVLTRGTDPLSPLLAAFAGWGEQVHDLAVNVFFALSGYLVTLSWLRRGSLVSFAVARGLRIWPGAVAACVVTVLAGAALTTLPLAEYATAEGTWAFLLRNSLLRKIAFELPGVFEANPYPRVVNGSLWSLPYELRCYAYVGLLGVAGILSRRLAFNLLLGVMLLDFLVPGAGLLPFGETFWRLWLHFAGGAALAANRDRIPLRGDVLLVLAGLAAAASLFARGPVHAVAAAAAMVYAVHWAGQARLPGWVDPARRGDLSYGTYLYAFPVQQGLVSLDPEGWGGWGLTLASLPVVLVLAALSWRWVERPALGGREGATAAIVGALRRLRPLRS